MTKEELDISIREVVPSDSKRLLDYMKRSSAETEFMLTEETITGLTVEQEAEYIARISQSENNCLLAAVHKKQLIGVASVHAASEQELRHIGDVGISVDKEYQGMGLGTIMMEELVEWAERSGIIRRLELKVQQRNERAVHLYEKTGFRKEALMERGIYLNDSFLGVWLMSKLIDETEKNSHLP